jgi:hypothetical protein
LFTETAYVVRAVILQLVLEPGVSVVEKLVLAVLVIESAHVWLEITVRM